MENGRVIACFDSLKVTTRHTSAFTFSADDNVKDRHGKQTTFIDYNCDFTLEVSHTLVHQDVLRCYNSAQFVSVILL